MNSLNVKRGDTVVVLTGKDKGKQGKILTASPANETVTVEGINIVTKHVKPRGAQNPGGMQKLPGNTHISNVMLVCPDCGKPTRVAHTLSDGKWMRTCKKCGALMDKVVKATTKKTTKKAVNSEEGVEVKPKRTAKKKAAPADDQA